MLKRRYIIYADESDRKGRYYSNFFGGVVLDQVEQQSINEILNKKKHELGINGEIKWQYVDQSRVERYEEFIKLYFSFISESKIRLRIMFTQNMHVPNALEPRSHKEQYFVLYYQFIKHAFGIAHSNPDALDKVYFTILPDKLPDSQQNVEKFKDFLCRIPETRHVKDRKIFIPRSDIADVDSKEHVILQGLDLILGSVCARLNSSFDQKPPGKRIRGKRTRAKERLYKTINRQIRLIYPNFNIGVTTACPNGNRDRWSQPYRHWVFTPKSYTLDRSLGKKTTPTLPTNLPRKA